MYLPFNACNDSTYILILVWTKTLEAILFKSNLALKKSELFFDSKTACTLYLQKSIYKAYAAGWYDLPQILNDRF